jgi:4-amino-4-deoxy-L-arabinose transferase-like glycosyltransferase
MNPPASFPGLLDRLRPHARPLLFLFFGLVLGLRMALASTARHPGDADPAFYYAVAQNLLDGRGLTIGYIWQYLSDPPAVTHTSFDYWLPGTSVIQAVAMRLFGRSLFAALGAGVVASIGLALLTLAIARRYSRSEFVALGSAALVAVLPIYFDFSLRSESPIFYALFAAASLLMMVRGLDDPRAFLGAGVLAALAQMTRQDGLLLVPTLLLAVALAPQKAGPKLAFGAGAVALYVLTLSPLLAANLRAFGSVFPPAPAKSLLFTSYSDLYAYGVEPTVKGFYHQSPAEMFLPKGETALRCLGQLLRYLWPVLLVFAAWGAWDARRDTGPGPSGRRGYVVPLAFLTLLFVFYSLLATFPGRYGGFERSALATAPFLVVFALEAIRRHVPSPQARILVVAAHVAAFGVFGFRSAAREIRDHSVIERQMGRMQRFLEGKKRPGESIVLLTKDPWEVHFSTRYPCLMLPSNGREAALAAGRRYGGNYLMLTVPPPAFQELYDDENSDPRFRFVGRVPKSKIKLYRLAP